MIYEFAVDPALVASWHDRKKYRMFKGFVGVGTCRILCRYPRKKWRRLVMDAFHDELRGASKADKQNAKMRLDALINHIEQQSTARTRSWRSDTPWRVCATEEHEQREFQAILVRRMEDDPELCAPLLDADQVDGDCPRWNPQPGAMLRTRANALDALTPVLNHACDIRLVDPYFNLKPKDGYLDLLVALVERAQRARADDEPIVFQLHTGIDRDFKPPNIQTPTAMLMKAREITNGVLERVRPVLASRSQLIVCIWSANDHYAGRDKLHDRFLLTETGGIKLGDSFNMGGKGFETMTLLSRPQWVNRRQVFSDSATEFYRVYDASITG